MSEVDRSNWIVRLGDKDYPTYPYVLDEAHKRGLAEIDCDLIQIPTAENGHVAIVRATVRLSNSTGGQTFSAYGDASPANVNSRIASALIRMAETRGKGRALRDACNIGMTLAEELPDEERRETNGHERAPATPASPRRADTSGVAGASRVDPAGACSWPECETLLNKNQVTLSKHHADRPLCPQHLAEFRREKEAATR